MEDRVEQNISVKKLMDRLEKLRNEHDQYNTDYENGFRDGVQQTMNEIVGILDGKNLK